MVSRGRRCLCSLLVLTGFLLGTAHGESTDNITTVEPSTTAAFCTEGKCQNGGTCMEDTDMCQCAPGFNGSTCETDLCAMLACQNDGTCDISTDPVSCVCTDSWQGQTCADDVDECLMTGDDYPCDAVNGNCTNNPGSYECTCNSGFEPGTQDSSMCKNIDDCANVSCQNGGTCYDFVNDYNCTCPEGFNGTHCEFDIRDCNSTSCQNGGTCIEGTNYFNCSCAPGFNGTYCDNICPAGTHGDYCMESCTCVEGANCSNVDGYCSCDPAFDAAVCDKRDVYVTARRITLGDISKGDDFTLACQVNLAGIDLENVTWYRNGVELPDTTNSDYMIDQNPDMGMYNITILQADAEDSGSYICTTVTKGNQFRNSSDGLQINVNVPGTIDRERSKLEDYIRLNQTASLNCTVFSSSGASIAWERNGKRLEDGTNRTSISAGQGIGTGGMYFFSELEISEIVRADNGIYSCLALDEAENVTDNATFNIFVQEIPELTSPSFKDVLSTQVTLEWVFTVQGNDDNINCTANYTNEETNETGQQYVGKTSPGVVENLDPFTTYEFLLVCENLVGRSEPLSFEPQKTLAGRPSPPLNVTVSDVQARQVSVQWLEPVEKNGPIDGYIIQAINQDGDKNIFDNTSGETNIDLDGLTPYTTYKITVQASNNNDKERTISDLSQESEEFQTMQAAPGSPAGFDVRDTVDHCVITWREPEEPNGVIVGYTLYEEVLRKDTEEVVSTTRREYDATRLDVSIEKSVLYSIYRYSLTATTYPGEGINATTSDTCETPEGDPITPSAIPPAPKDTITRTSFKITLPPYDARNGPVSCYEVIVIELGDAKAIDNLNSTQSSYHPNNIVSYNEAKGKEGVAYRAAVFSDLPADVIIGVGMENTTNCHTGVSTGSSRRRRRETISTELLEATNGPLNEGGIYSLFVRVYTPTSSSSQEAFYESGPFMAPVRLDSSPNVAAIVGGIFGVLIAICLVGVILIMYRRNQENGMDPLMTPTSNGPRENGNGAIGLQNLGIDDGENEMVVKPIKLENLERAIRQKAQDEKRIFWAEYKALPNRPPPMATMNNSNHPANKDKNRYINIIAYDHTRVRLKTIDGIEGSDYINASYVNGYQYPDKFIAAQGPKENTLEDFWRMIWEYDCSTIVMLTKCVEDGKDKCSQYWPEKGSTKFGMFKVTLDSVKETAEYVIRTFLLSEDGKESGKRTITQFHFLGWPDHGQPDYPSPMLCLIKRVRHLTAKMTQRANIVVHCSAGVGRTGTYIVIDAMLDMMKHQNQVDVYNFIHEIRQQRNTLVQSFVQYFFIHMALLEEYLFGHSDVAMPDFPSYYQELSNKSELDDDLTKLEVEFRRACKLGVNGVEQKFANIEQNKDKNRIGHILPYDKNVVKLERLIGEEFSDYINASYITGYQRKNMYIATQGPLPNTISDFWRMIWESQTSTIVMLTEISQKGHEMCAQYWPLEIDETEEHGSITVTLVSETDDDEAFTIRDLEISHAKIMQNIYGNVDAPKENSAEGVDDPKSDSQNAIYGNVDESTPPTPVKNIRKIRQYHFRGWPEVGVPESGIDLMRLVNQSHLHQKEKGPNPIVVHCSAGAGRTGVFIALNILMSRLEEESMIDVFQTVRGLRQQRPHMVQDLAQFKFCYSAMVEYLESQSTEYQNFVLRV